MTCASTTESGGTAAQDLVWASPRVPTSDMPGLTARTPSAPPGVLAIGRLRGYRAGASHGLWNLTEWEKVPFVGHAALGLEEAP